MHTSADLHGILAIWYKLYVDGKEGELEPGYVMGRTVNNLLLRGSLEVTMEGIFDIRNDNGDVVCGSNGKNQPDCRC